MEEINNRANENNYEEPHDDYAINKLDYHPKHGDNRNNRDNDHNQEHENSEEHDNNQEDEDEDIESEVEVPQVHEKRGNFIFRQELSSFTPECNAKNALCCNFFMVVMFAGVGIAIIFSSNAISEYRLDYTDCIPDELGLCSLDLTINSTLTAPLYVYYELTSFYSNHRDYVKSKIWRQLRAEIEVDETNNTDCRGAITMAEMFENDTTKYKSHTGEPMLGTDWANPCGLIAKAFFNGNIMIN